MKNQDCTYGTIKLLLKKCPHLISLSIRGGFCGGGDDTVLFIAKNCIKLEKLYWHDLRMGDLGLSYIPLLLNLKELDISLESKTTLAGVRIMIVSFHNLQILHIHSYSYNKTFSDDVLRLIGIYCPSLKELKYGGGEQPSNESILAVIEGCPSLETIYIRRADSTQYDDTILYAIAEHCPCTQYIHLGFNSQSYTDQGLIALSRGCPELRELNCSELTAITDACIISFAQYCHKLERIAMNELTNLTSHALCLLLQVSPNLTSLLLRDTDQLDDECLLGIAQYCHKLTSLILEGNMRLTQSTLTLLIKNPVLY